MLIVSRRAKETIEITPMTGEGSATLDAVFSCKKSIQISVIKLGKSRVSIAIDAPQELRIWRSDKLFDGLEFEVELENDSPRDVETT